MVSLDEVFDLLSEKRRRYALYYLRTQESPISVRELAEAVAEMESDADSPAVSETELGRYEIKLHHTDLPKADTAEFIEYDADAGVVRLTGEPPEFDVVLTVAEVIERSS
ncbi:DUF7344 domain-containing protein [Haloarcula amylovorans]|uniref:DUF7344 domain-containing protein n=1 Tax=Haloarcula amylovorans TaxID=2562280 RepID=UPI0010761302|nr:hypothetical protein [Halomicroarcula amylolytica]